MNTWLQGLGPLRVQPWVPLLVPQVLAGAEHASQFVGVLVQFGFRLKVALKVLLASMVTVQLPVPEHAPDQLAKVESAAGVAVMLTEVPVLKFAVQILPTAQLLIPAGEEDMVPEPVPPGRTSRL